jgi:hypothetical protein
MALEWTPVEDQDRLPIRHTLRTQNCAVVDANLSRREGASEPDVGPCEGLP